MKTTAAIIAAVLLTGLALGNAKTRREEGLKHRLYLAEKKVERFENYTVFANAQYVAKITGTPLYQVLTGNLVPKENQ